MFFAAWNQTKKRYLFCGFLDFILSFRKSIVNTWLKNYAVLRLYLEKRAVAW